jgi:proton-translocating NADH-quinone oxidoreductase chain L
MSEDPHKPRFFSYLSLFTTSMIVLVCANNLVLLFLGWEGVGISSYLLIGFWYTRLAASKSAIKAMLFNRVGDCALALAMFQLYTLFGTFEFAPMFACAHCGDFSVSRLYTLSCILLFIGCMGKSAQLGLNPWLADAMEGPTPVSALLHAATMVTAGVFLLVRCTPLFSLDPIASLSVACVGVLTTVFAGSVACVSYDIKKVIAYSTCSQLGYMVFAVGASMGNYACFHLWNHAWFKALLFLSAGVIIHALGDEQDMRKMGGVVRIVPGAYVGMCVGSLALMGIPFYTGFYSKDSLLSGAYVEYTVYAHFVFYLGCLAVGMTAYYVTRMLKFTFYTHASMDQSNVRNVHPSDKQMATILFVLSIASVFMGYLTYTCMIGAGTDFWSTSIQTHVLHRSVEAEFNPSLSSIRLLPLLFTVCGSILGWVQTDKQYRFLQAKWGIDTIINKLITYPVLGFAQSVPHKSFDKGVIEYALPYGVPRLTRYTMRLFSRIHTGVLSDYAFVILCGLGVILLVSVFTGFGKQTLVQLVCIPLFIR